MTLPNARQRRCGDCLAVVTGIFCAQCGQKQKSPVRHFRQLAGEFFNDVLNLDTRLLDTLKTLLLRPGRLSTEYFADRRTRYLSPIKLYFLLSIVAFFLIQQSLDTAVEAEAAVVAPGKAGSDDMNFTIGNFNGKAWNAKSNPIAVSWLPDAANDLMNERLGRLENTVRQKDWTQLLHAGLAATPQALLLLLPFFALLLKLAYLFRKRLYMEHLIVALHNHAFLLLAISIGLVLSAMSGWVAAGWWPALFGLLGSLLAFWVPAYFLIGLKHIYRQSWKMTVFKFGLLGFCYLNLLAVGVIFNVIIGLLML
ncbi:DUF3667 domain-containing protein [Arenimonas sp. GDDSR-1]|uniref:DUF3667 domain-containing protein n=1 Tax=Arenimonas sp. GDDSR-1 TaxID=2950125 RepID=UPI0026035F27|nr:DUF3667 domain-containing protein [Arenimonas sp. GDDSR-1]